MNDHYFVYALYDPRLSMDSKNARYVGVTGTSPKKRLRRHLDLNQFTGKDLHKWLSSLALAGVNPKMVIITSSAKGAWDETERFWIAYFKMLGANLVNGNDGGQGYIAQSNTTPQKQYYGKRRMFTARLPAEVHNMLRVLATEDGLTKTDELRKLIHENAVEQGLIVAP